MMYSEKIVGHHRMRVECDWWSISNLEIASRLCDKTRSWWRNTNWIFLQDVFVQKCAPLIHTVIADNNNKNNPLPTVDAMSISELFHAWIWMYATRVCTIVRRHFFHMHTSRAIVKCSFRTRLRVFAIVFISLCDGYIKLDTHIHASIAYTERRRVVDMQIGRCNANPKQSGKNWLCEFCDYGPTPEFILV